MDIWEHDLKEIGELVVGEAYSLFEEVGCTNDFCIQHIGDRVVFGGTNRLIWDVDDGFDIDRPYCTPRFITKMELALAGRGV